MEIKYIIEKLFKIKDKNFQKFNEKIKKIVIEFSETLNINKFILLHKNDKYIKDTKCLKIYYSRCIKDGEKYFYIKNIRLHT